MKLARLVEPYHIKFEEAQIPSFQDDEVLVNVNCFGICSSDMQMYHGKHKYCAMPVIMGHECCATVEKLGNSVKDYVVGEKVTIEPQVVCGECFPCRSGRFNVCTHLKTLGVHMDGCNQEYLAVKSSLLHHVPQDMDDDLVCLVEPTSVGVGSIKRSKLFKGGNVVVVGAGTIGNLVAQSAKALGAAKVLITDINQTKLDYALEAGIDFAANTSEITLKDAIVKNLGNDMADVIVDCVAVPAVFKSILGAARPRSEIIITGNYKVPVEVEIPMIQRKEIDVLGHMMYIREDFKDAIKLLHEGKIKTDRLISQKYNFENYPKAFEFADEYPFEVMKIIVKI
jgi:L-iditol 2-dehydrogenase